MRDGDSGMTLERKAEINRRLAEFEGWYRDGKFWRYQGNDTLVATHPLAIDYTESLDRLVRLEGKLPPHHWSSVGAGHVWGMWSVDDGGFMGEGCEETEAEARAEAIMQYLEKTDGKP